MPRRVARADEVGLFVVLVGAERRPPALGQRVLHLEGEDVPTLVAAHVDHPPGAVDDAGEPAALVVEGDGVVVAVDDARQQITLVVAQREEVAEPVVLQRVAPLVSREHPAREAHRAAHLDHVGPGGVRARLDHPQRAPSLLDHPAERVRPAVAQAEIVIGDRRRVAAREGERDRPGQREIDDRHRVHAAVRGIDRITRVGAGVAVHRVGAAAAAPRPARSGVLPAAVGVVAAVVAARPLTGRVAVRAFAAAPTGEPTSRHDPHAGVHSRDGRDVGNRCGARHPPMFAEPPGPSSAMRPVVSAKASRVQRTARSNCLASASSSSMRFVQ